MEKLKIVITNDDGINARGIHELAKSLSKIGEVTVIAPVTEQSAVGHAITMKYPLRITEHYDNGDFFGYAVDGTPADCIKIGINNILQCKPDLVISGINHGSNTAINILYSGTVSAAREAAIMDIPAIAVSVTSHRPKHFEFAAEYAAELALQTVEKKIPAGTLLNLNVPDLPKEEIKGIKLTKQGKSKWDEKYVERVDPFGGKYYWLAGELKELDRELDVDQFAVLNGYVSVTPVHFDLTDYKTFESMKKWDLEKNL